ncbi:bifunctional [glutamine synthetase] adenylyltransferase/[glutamine synthetase]-adenylyl-L-tyrosine phosphorylase [Terricaulis sp.]|uniref:bifunctional [glutamine synthetase] adenylyltransferase/[glutamine synthetase]-adenylyl-L-tyrosine phosphorylase n=1 Tax=Terricaulis sp. TaxID=2768686 RepID=UPI002AC648C9|nr:bifunctional [glutamine synthetase] adenylyltransferase/[glutamine synthetase]-adenylyl-L-tyrosine phosphorylase [Terricaulis sp.]MDZ4693482.1 bifunctional [glutamine synthetase] adenylyltransferase/[glutamine synthetase]-adenylyl-L-tyrosine phosphorylase [Terricaulis sp.]
MRAVAPALARGAPPPAFAGTHWAGAAAAALESAPYLKRLMERRSDLLANADSAWADRLRADALATANAIADEPPPIEEAMRTLRRAKDALHLCVALADLNRTWPLHQVTGAITDFADAALRAALAVGAQESARRGDFELGALGGERGPVPGLTLIAMGKMGARELNYSSDIDFSVFFETQLLSEAKAREPRVAAVRLVAPIVRMLEEVTADGYVFRTDLRLRPDPGSTPVAVGLAAAEHYYQNLGQNWERAAFIKARAAAGDVVCGREFLASLEPFIWRKHLDFAAVEDVHSIKRQILSAHKSAELGDPVFDVKLGRGGIRDIELFAQTQQLILGGRNRKLRTQGTISALDALSEAGAISGDARDALSEAYVFFREIEHRIQMLEDAHTHRVPADPETRARLAALSGFEGLDAFDAALIERRRIVSDVDHQLFGRGESLADPLGSLIFTGVEDHAETLTTITSLGFTQAAFVSQTIRGWHHGRIRAMRSERAREILTRLTPRLLRALAGAGDPDQAFVRFSSFFAGLSAGVQLLALLDARPAFLDLLARILSLAPRLADDLARRPALLDALIEPRFALPLSRDTPGEQRAELAERLSIATSFEHRLNAARRFQREEAFRIDVQVLEGQATAADAGAAHAELAEACVVAMAEAALAEVERTNGSQPGAFVVLALGKFGGRELAEGSDLDLMLVYDAPPDAAAPGEFYTRMTQRLISALSAPTEEGALYEIDTKLRPSGSKGPVAVRLSSFERYYAEEAWTWELQALTRLRPVAGDVSLSKRVQETAMRTLAAPREQAKVLADVAEMRGRMERERAAKSIWDLKLAPGGLVDIEFIAQALQLVHAADALDALSPNTGEALQQLHSAGKLDAQACAKLTEAWALWSALQHLLRICVAGEFKPDDAPAPLLERLAALGGVPDFEALEAKVRSVQGQVRELFTQIVGPLGDGSQALRR